MEAMFAAALIFSVFSSIFFFFFLLLAPRRDSVKGETGLLPPGPKPWPLVGSLLTLQFHKPAFRWMLHVADGKPITCVHLGSTHVIVVNSPEIAREFLKKHDATFSDRPITMASEYSSRGFLTTAVSPLGEQWKKMRRILSSDVINMRRFRWQHDLRVEEADHLLKYVKHSLESSGEKPSTIDVRAITRLYCGNVARRMIFGLRCFGKGEELGWPGKAETEHTEAALTILSLLYMFAVSDYFPRLRWLDLEGHERMVVEAAETINKFHDPIIDERVNKWRHTYSETKLENNGEPEDLLEVMISLKDSDGKPLLTVEEIKAQAAELIYATVDNPSNGVEWAMAEMLREPKLLEKATEELDRVVGRDRLVQEADFPNLPYIKACAREAFRLHPVAPFNIPHVSTEEAVVGGYLIPKGSHVLLSRYGLGRNAEVWEDPLRFEPERHLDVSDNEASVEAVETELRFISFSTGRRGCMAPMVGSAMTYMLLARLLQCFQWSAPPGGVDLSEEKGSLLMATPLVAVVKPRLPHLLEKLI